MVKRLRMVVLVLALLIAGCAPGATKPPALPGAGGAGGLSAVPPEAAAKFEDAKRAFLATFKEEAIYGRAQGSAGFQYPEKEALGKLPAGSLLAGIKEGLAGAKSRPEMVFWLDLFSVVPDHEPGAAQVLLDYLISLPPEGDRYLAYQSGRVHLARLMREEDAALLMSMLGRYDEGLQYLLLSVLHGQGILTVEKAIELLKQPDVYAQAVVAHLDPITAGVLSLLGKDFTKFTTKTQVVVAERVGHLSKWGPGEGLKRDALSWLNTMLEKSREPAVRQEILYQVYQVSDSKESLDHLVVEVEKDGTTPGLNIWGNHYLLREIRSSYPDSYLARGFVAYEKVRGRPYFVLDFWDSMRNDPWPFKYGSGQYEPAKEIPGWLEFLEDFSKHPGADDAAYRLGRCYELQGKWKEALTWLAKAAVLPDGDLHFDSRGRLLFVLDGRVPPAELEKLAGDPEVVPELKPLIEYTLAVRDIRDENYQRASERLAAFIERYGDKGADATGELLLGGAVGVRYPFWARIREQQGWVSSLAEQTARLKSDSSNPEALYQLGAEIYRNQFIYYNFLWAGARQGFNWVGHINELWAEIPEKQAYLQGLINYQHALKCFEAVEKSPQATGDLKAKALYSQGLAHIGILQWGLDSETVLGAESIRGKIVDTYKRFIETYSRSSMADDALLTLYAYTKDKAYLERLLTDYANGDRACEARELLQQVNP
ncbi:MAG: hypothetical protein HPY55_09100 [Firmicutes bacterium]|nr:hypothetical protein [Bacillota bacterium]